jgi:hypothetical protein
MARGRILEWCDLRVDPVFSEIRKRDRNPSGGFYGSKFSVGDDKGMGTLRDYQRFETKEG